MDSNIRINNIIINSLLYPFRWSILILLILGQPELQGIIETLTREVEGQSNLLVRLLQLRDKRAAKLEKLYHRMTAILEDYATKNGMDCSLQLTRRSKLFPTGNSVNE